MAIPSHGRFMNCTFSVESISSLRWDSRRIECFPFVHKIKRKKKKKKKLRHALSHDELSVRPLYTLVILKPFPVDYLCGLYGFNALKIDVCFKD